MNSCFRLWTPEMAQKTLERCNTNNRMLRKYKATEYANKMRKGLWDENALDPIVINKYGVLENGQHRLMGVVLYGKPVRFFTVTDSEPAYGYFDRGMKRSAADVLNGRGSLNKTVSNNTVAIVNAMLKLYGFDSCNRTDEVIEAYFEMWETKLNEAYSATSKGEGKTNIAKIASCGVAAFNALRLGVDEEDLNRFFTIVNTGFGNSPEEYSAIVLRNMLLEYRNDPRHIHGVKKYNDAGARLFAATENAILDFYNKVPRKRRYTTTVENAPLLYKAKEFDREFIEKYKNGVKA